MWRKSKSLLYRYRHFSKTGLIDHVKTDDICKHSVEDVGRRCNTSNYELNRLLPKGKNKKVIGIMKDEAGRKFINLLD